MSRPEQPRGASWWLRSTRGAVLWAVLLAAVVLGVHAAGSPTDLRVATTFLIYLVVAVGLQTFTGNSGLISFAHVGLMALGAYAAAIFTVTPAIKKFEIPDAPALVRDAHLGFVPATLIAIAVTMAFALAVGVPIVRLSGAAAAVGTLGLLVIIFTVLSNYDTLTGGARTFYGIPQHTSLAVGWACASLAVLASRLFRDSGVGLCLRASRNDELAARASGVRVMRCRLFAWVLSGGIVALGGSLYAHYVLALTPRAFYFDLTMLIVTMIIVGGASISGAALGAAVVTLMTEFLRRAENGFSLGPLDVSQAPGLSTIGLGLLILLTMAFRPGGLLGRWELEEWVGRALAGWRGPHRPGPAEEGPAAGAASAAAAGVQHGDGR